MEAFVILVAKQKMLFAVTMSWRNVSLCSHMEIVN